MPLQLRKAMQLVMTNRSTCISLLLTATLCSAVPLKVAEAQKAPEQQGLDMQARSLFQAGRIAFEGGRYAQALDYFKQAYQLSPRPLLLYNIGTALDRLRHDEEALRTFEQYLREMPEAPNRAATEARIRVLRQAVRARDSAEAARAGAAGGVGPPNPPAASVASSASPPPRHAAMPPPVTAQELPSAQAASGSIATAPSTLEPRQQAQAGKPLWTWVAAGSAGVFGGAALVFWLRGNSQYDKLQKTCNPAGSCSEEELQRQVDASGVKTSDLLANVSLGLAVVSLAAGVTLFALESSSAHEDRAALALEVAPSGLRLRGSF